MAQQDLPGFIDHGLLLGREPERLRFDGGCSHLSCHGPVLQRAVGRAPYFHRVTRRSAALVLRRERRRAWKAGNPDIRNAGPPYRRVA
ncbi:hypothetical protein Ga0080559_TMP3085 [Salipiger profundus]|uniref:Uncharacterized protein n=1 Tax=Salipiger profundus TaxID=1229727 RepID=A0A1U7D6V0_9RHOB|nr:hypothetical protein Ga0080559_TMP3085 [Salipiger profundus]